MNTIEGQRYIIEEYLANQADLQKLSGFKSFVQKIKLALRKVGFRAKWTDDEILTLMRRSLANQQGKKSGAEGNGNVRFMSEPFTEQQKKDLLQQARNSGLKNIDVIEKITQNGYLLQAIIPSHIVSEMTLNAEQVLQDKAIGIFNEYYSCLNLVSEISADILKDVTSSEMKKEIKNGSRRNR